MKLIGLAGLAIGGLIAVVVTLHPEGLNTPRWVAYLASSAFALAGCSSLAHGYKRASLAEGCVALVLSAFLIIGLWITFAPGAHQCGGGITGLGFAASDASCRVAFGIGSIVVGVMLFFAVRGLLQRRPAG